MYCSILKNIFDICLLWFVDVLFGFVDYDVDMGEYFFDCYLSVFFNVLNYYCMGYFYCLLDVCGFLFEDELNFWGIDDQ